MTTSLHPRHVPLPARGLAASHRELRQAQASLRVATQSVTCPPAGHAFWGLLHDASDSLQAAVARHLEHELQHLPASSLHAELEEQHTALIVRAVGMHQMLRGITPGDEQAWPALRLAAQRVIDTLGRHLDLEERTLLRRHVLKGQSPSIA